MKCPHCGSQLSIDDAFCPFCGHANEKAKEYTTTMKHYEEELSSVKHKVEKSTHFIKDLVVFLIVAVVLCIANIVLVLMNKNIYDVKRYIACIDINRHYDEYCHTLDTLVSTGEYVVFDSFLYGKDIYLSPKMDSYSGLNSYTDQYNSIFEYMSILVFDEMGKSTPSKDQALTYISGAINRFYQMYNGDKTSYPNYKIQENHWQQVEILNQKLRTLLSYYFSMTEQELDQLENMSDLQIAMFLGRRLNIYE